MTDDRPEDIENDFDLLARVSAETRADAGLPGSTTVRYRGKPFIVKAIRTPWYIRLFAKVLKWCGWRSEEEKRNPPAPRKWRRRKTRAKR